MKRIEGDRFTQGDPNTGLPATIITATWCNDMQEEVCNAILSRKGAITNTPDELAQALEDLSRRGMTLPVLPMVAKAEKESDAVPIAGLKFDKDRIKVAYFNIHFERKTSENFQSEEWTAAAIFTFIKEKNKLDWDISTSSILSTSGAMSICIDETGQVKYTCRELKGDNYRGEIRIGHIRFIYA